MLTCFTSRPIVAILLQYKLGTFYKSGKMGLAQDRKSATEYYAKAAEGGNLTAGHNLGCAEKRAGEYVAAMRRWRWSASGGFRESIRALILRFEDGMLHHDDLAETLQAFYLARAEMKSDGRDWYISYLKMKGEYRAEYDM